LNIKIILFQIHVIEQSKTKLGENTPTKGLLNNHQTLDLVTRAIVICLAIQLILSSKLWLITNRDFPLLPIFPSSLSLNFDPAASLFLFAFLMLSFVLILFKPQNKYFLGAALFLFTILVLQDLNRLQVWLYQLVLMLAVLIFRKDKNENQVFKSLQIIIIAVYFWAGWSKFNIYFVEDVFPWLLDQVPILLGFKGATYLPYFMAALEMMIGVGLFVRRLRWIYVPIALLFHVFILLSIGPFGQNWNTVVWPWNILLMLLVVLFFYKKNNRILEDFKYTIKYFPVFAYCLLVVGLLPFLNYLQKWDENLSFKMYSGTHPEAVFYFDESDHLCFPPEMASYFIGKNQDKKLIIDDWTLSELKVSPYLNQNTINQLQAQLCQCLEQPEHGGLKVLRVDYWDKEKDVWEDYPCMRSEE